MKRMQVDFVDLKMFVGTSVWEVFKKRWTEERLGFWRARGRQKHVCGYICTRLLCLTRSHYVLRTIVGIPLSGLEWFIHVDQLFSQQGWQINRPGTIIPPRVESILSASFSPLPLVSRFFYLAPTRASLFTCTGWSSSQLQALYRSTGHSNRIMIRLFSKTDALPDWVIAVAVSWQFSANFLFFI